MIFKYLLCCGLRGERPSRMPWSERHHPTPPQLISAPSPPPATAQLELGVGWWMGRDQLQTWKSLPQPSPCSATMGGGGSIAHLPSARSPGLEGGNMPYVTLGQPPCWSVQPLPPLLPTDSGQESRLWAQMQSLPHLPQTAQLHVTHCGVMATGLLLEGVA